MNASRRFEPLQFREHRNCTVMPLRRRDDGFEMGVFDASGTCIPETLLRRTHANGRENQIGHPGAFGPALASHAGPAIYLGPLLNLYGHFLLESLARAWLAKQYPDMPLVWSCRASSLKPWQRGILDLLGVQNPLVWVDSPVRFERLIIPDIGYQVQSYFHPEHAEFLAAVPYEPLPGRKLWLSRSRLKHLQNTSMPALERRLADLGWTIVYPETLSVAEQVAHIASAERIAGEQGSALHSIIFLKHPKDLRVDFFLRDPFRKRYNQNYDTIAQAKGIHQRAIRIYSESIDGVDGRHLSKHSSNISDYIEALSETCVNGNPAIDIRPPAPDPTPSPVKRRAAGAEFRRCEDRLPLEPLTFREYRDCTVMPYRRKKDERGAWELGVFAADGTCLEESLLYHAHANGRPRQVGYPAELRPARQTLPGPAIYLGPLMEHFGHFLLESLSRVWLAKRMPEVPVVWSCRVGAGAAPGAGALARWQEEILATVGVTNPGIFVTEPVRFERLIVPELGNHFQQSFHPEHAAALGVVPHAPVPGRRVWLSRSKLADRMQNLSMPEVEARLAGLGWTVLYPEEMSFSEQVAALAGAERIAGEQGSAFHSILFLKDPSRLRVDLFLNDPERGKSPRDRHYDLIAAVTGVDQRMHRVASEVVTRRGKGFRVEKYSTDLDEYLEKLDTGKAPDAMPMLDILRPKSPTQPPAPAGPRPGHSPKGRTSAARINRLCTIRPATRYLEVGVARGGTFLAVDIPTKHGVDPRFRFDTTPHATERVRFFQVPSDDYFTREVPPDLRFDIIFLDGLHTFEQTFRDFCASMTHAHRDTVWIIDDVFPSDVFSAMPSQENAVAFRRQHGRGSRAWHGDVYKCVFAIHDFFPNLSFRTFEPGPDNPQTVILNRPRPDFAPRFDNLEAISRLDYYDFWENRALLNLLPEDAVFDWVADALKSA